MDRPAGGLPEALTMEEAMDEQKREELTMEEMAETAGTLDAEEEELFTEGEEPEEEDTDGTTEQEKRAPGSALLDWAQSIVFSVIPMVLIFAFLARTTGVVGSSMIPTLEEKDRLVISRLFYTPKKGDIVVISKRSELFPDSIIKRVIATEGQTIRFNFDTGEVWVDGALLEEDYIAEATRTREDLQSGVDYIVPENCVFVMGDNRNRSSDSRKSEIGMVDTRHILGRVLIRILPITKFGKVR